ncbi:hypothetical protein ACJMK2_004598 [Sinanodonta woodiana]|uniref:Galactosylgalactosylxylosylprotein 3-beta-glucuronosyltransferase n=1 Tax=Sinanodonta woodiana TaxID=1069815 RepID=A0ABD3Y3J4_SINWO
MPTIVAITPTYFRLEQKADITRLCQTFRLVENLRWLLVEDSFNKTALVQRVLNNCKVPYTHLNAPTPQNIKNAPGKRKFPRGGVQRNAALAWIRKHVDPKETKGTVYFADDDNTYDVRIFEEMRYTKVVSVWPVGLVNAGKFESPMVKDGKVVGWIFVGDTRRRFPVDMAGFAINVQLLFSHPKAEFTSSSRANVLESSILEGLNVTLADMEPRAKNCTEKTNIDGAAEGSLLTNFRQNFDLSLKTIKRAFLQNLTFRAKKKLSPRLSNGALVV